MPKKYKSDWRETEPEGLNLVIFGAPTAGDHREIRRWVRQRDEDEDDERVPTVIETDLGLFVSCPTGSFTRETRFHKTRKGAMTAASIVRHWAE